MRKVVVSIELGFGFILLLVLVLQARAAPVAPAGRHCGSAGPLPLNDPEFCGCTWGEVLFHGRPVPGVAITLTHAGDVVTGVTRLTELEPVPYFDLTAHNIGANGGDVLTLTARFGGETITRAFRAWPEADGEQRIVLALEERGVWRALATGGYTQALALEGDTVWAGGPGGVISVSLSSGVSVAHALPLDDPTVRALVINVEEHVWAVGSGGVAKFDGSTWHTYTVPLTGTPRALAVDASEGIIWLGGGDTDGSVAAYDGSWQAEGAFGAPVTALTVDEAGRVWAGTWGVGVFRQDGQGGWTQFRDTDGLASDLALAAAASADAVWFGTWPYLSGGGPRGGISRYDLATGMWRTFTTTHGLLADAGLPQTPAPVYALDVDPRGWVWAGCVDGIRYLPDGEQWLPYTTTHGLRTGPVMALAATNTNVVAVSTSGVEHLLRTEPLDNPPTAQIEYVPSDPLLPEEILTLQGAGNAASGRRITAWDWASDVDGPLCTEVECALPHSLFMPGAHQITFRVQDDAGLWSASVNVEMTVQQGWHVFLPLVVRGK